MIELFVVIVIMSVLSVMLTAGIIQMRSVAQGTYCANSLRQLGAATRMYLQDHKQKCFDYCLSEPTGDLWYFGFETYADVRLPEGERTVDETQSPLYPYVKEVGGVEICPAFPYGQSIWKPKFKGASWGYGFNTFLSGENVMTLKDLSRVILFGDCAQVNTFQPPASPSNPLLEEFYMIEDSYATVQFRHGGSANMLFLDGHIEKFQMCPGTQDMRLPQANVGRITPFDSMEYLQ